MKKKSKSTKKADLFGNSYSKVHKLKKAADSHKRKIVARGGNVKTTKTPGGYKLEYSFK